MEKLLEIKLKIAIPLTNLSTCWFISEGLVCELGRLLWRPADLAFSEREHI